MRLVSPSYFLFFFLTARPLDSQNYGNWFLKIQCRFQLSSDQDEGILAVEIRDLDASSFLASSKFHSATRSGNKACVLLMISPLLLASWNYNDGMNFYYEISRGCYFLLCHPKFRRCVNQRHKHKRSMQGPRSKFSSGGAKEECVKEIFFSTSSVMLLSGLKIHRH